MQAAMMSTPEHQPTTVKQGGCYSRCAYRCTLRSYCSAIPSMYYQTSPKRPLLAALDLHPNSTSLAADVSWASSQRSKHGRHAGIACLLMLLLATDFQLSKPSTAGQRLLHWHAACCSRAVLAAPLCWRHSPRAP